MTIFKIVASLTPPKLGKFGERLALTHWTEAKRRIEKRHRQQTDFLVDGAPYDVKSSAVPCRRGNVFINTQHPYHGPQAEGINILRVGFFADCAVVSKEDNVLRRFSEAELMQHWHAIQQHERSAAEPRVPGGYDLWQAAQKQQVSQICARHSLSVRFVVRNGVEVQLGFGTWGPNNLHHGKRPEDMTVCLWTEGLRIHRVIAYRRTDIDELPWHNFNPPGLDPVLTMGLGEFEQFRHRFCFVSIEEFEKEFFK